MRTAANLLLLPFRRERDGFAFLVIAAVVLLFAGSGRSLLTPYDDAFFAGAAKRIAQGGGWLELRTADGPLLEKPPLAFWLEAVSIRALGPTTFAARLPGMLLAAGGLLAAYWLLRRRDGHRAALLGGLALLTTQQFIHFARRPVADGDLTVWTMLALLCWREGIAEPRPGDKATGRAGLWLLAAGVCVGLAVMTKGLAGLLPVAVIGLHVALTRSWDLIRRPAFAGLILAALIVALPWHLAMIARHGDEFTRQYFWGRQLSYATSGRPDIMPGDWLTIPRKVAENWWPWLLAFVPAVGTVVARGWRERGWARGEGRGRSRARDSWPLFLSIWCGAIVLLFQLARVKRHQYIMPAYPAMAFLAAWWILRQRHADRYLAATTFFSFAAIVVALLTPVWPREMDNNLYGTKLAAVRYLEAHPGLRGTLLVLDRDEGYCFTCDTADYYTGLAAADYTSDRLARALKGGRPVYVLVDKPLLGRLRADLPAERQPQIVQEAGTVALVRIAGVGRDGAPAEEPPGP